MGVWGRARVLEWFGRKPIDPLARREVSRLKSDTRALIRIANELERARSSAAEPIRHSGTDSDDLLRNLTAAEEQLASSIAGAASQSLSVRDLERDVIRPILQSTVTVSELAHGMIERAVRSAAHGAYT